MRSPPLEVIVGFCVMVGTLSFAAACLAFRLQTLRSPNPNLSLAAVILTLLLLTRVGKGSLTALVALTASIVGWAAFLIWNGDVTTSTSSPWAKMNLVLLLGAIALWLPPATKWLRYDGGSRMTMH